MENNKKNWKQYLPSNHFITIVAGCAVVIGLFFGIRGIIHHYQKKAQDKAFTEATGIQPNVKVGDLLYADTDKDGLPDWEEPLWGMDPNNPDTNGNGTSDGVEIAQKKAVLGKTETQTTPENLNETEKFSRDLFTTISALSQSGTLTNESVTNLTEMLGNQIITKNIANNFTDTDLKVVLTSGASIKKYHTDISAVINKYSPSKIGGEMDLMIAMFNANDPTKTTELSTIAENYKSFAKDLIAVSVPAEMSETHLTLANTAYKIGVSLADVKDVFDNPIVSMAGFISYTKESQIFMATTDGLHAYFQKNGILN